MDDGDLALASTWLPAARGSRGVRPSTVCAPEVEAAFREESPRVQDAANAAWARELRDARAVAAAANAVTVSSASWPALQRRLQEQSRSAWEAIGAALERRNAALQRRRAAVVAVDELRSYKSRFTVYRHSNEKLRLELRHTKARAREALKQEKAESAKALEQARADAGCGGGDASAPSVTYETPEAQCVASSFGDGSCDAYLTVVLRNDAGERDATTDAAFVEFLQRLSLSNSNRDALRWVYETGMPRAVVDKTLKAWSAEDVGELAKRKYRNKQRLNPPPPDAKNATKNYYNWHVLAFGAAAESENLADFMAERAKVFHKIADINAQLSGDLDDVELRAELLAKLKELQNVGNPRAIGADILQVQLRPTEPPSAPRDPFAPLNPVAAAAAAAAQAAAPRTTTRDMVAQAEAAAREAKGEIEVAKANDKASHSELTEENVRCRTAQARVRDLEAKLMNARFDLEEDTLNNTELQAQLRKATVWAESVDPVRKKMGEDALYSINNSKAKSTKQQLINSLTAELATAQAAATTECTEYNRLEKERIEATKTARGGFGALLKLRLPVKGGGGISPAHSQLVRYVRRMCAFACEASVSLRCLLDWRIDLGDTRSRFNDDHKAASDIMQFVASNAPALKRVAATLNTWLALMKADARSSVDARQRAGTQCGTAAEGVRDAVDASMDHLHLERLLQTAVDDDVYNAYYAEADAAFLESLIQRTGARIIRAMAALVDVQAYGDDVAGFVEFQFAHAGVAGVAMSRRPRRTAAAAPDVVPTTFPALHAAAPAPAPALPDTSNDSDDEF